MKTKMKSRFFILSIILGVAYFGYSLPMAKADIGDQTGSSTQSVGVDLKKIDSDVSSLKVGIVSQFVDGISQAIESNSDKVTPESINKAVQLDRIDLLKFIDDSFSLGAENILSQNQLIKDGINTSIKKIAGDISKATKKNVSLDSVSQNISQSLDTFVQTDSPKFDALKNDHVDLMYKDSDGDGVSDYDEIYVYHTDPYKANTAGGSLNDGQKILQGFNPLSAESEKIKYSAPEDSKAVASSTYSVTELSLDQNTKALTVKGTSLPNSYVTLYIYSTPIVVTVKANALGEWTYTLDQELNNGDHKMYVASVDTAGKILARSDLFPFVKTASAATLGQPIETPVNNSIRNIVVISISIFVILLVLMISFIGIEKKNKTEKEIK
ncbi:MAG: Ig-like domain-containing protein [bacterium]